MLQFSANLYRIAQSIASDEETRYYLTGVYVEPAPRGHAGVMMTATDGHRLMCIWDADGKADESAIIKLSDFALKACKGRNVVRVETGSEVARVHEFPKHIWGDVEIDRLAVVAQSGVETAIVTSTRWDDEYGIECQVTTRIRGSESCKIDGTFPAYRNVIPTMPSSPDQWSAAFNGAYIASFGKIAGELASHFGASKKEPGTIRVLSPSPSDPAIIAFPSTPQAFGVVMPMRADTDSVSLPGWYTPLPEVPPAEVLMIADYRQQDAA